MEQLLLNLGPGNWQTGFANITAQLWEDRQQPMQFVGSLPPAPQLEAQYQQWQALYQAIYGDQNYGNRLGIDRAGWRRAANPPAPDDSDTGSDFEFDFGEETLLNVSSQAFEALCNRLSVDLNNWLDAASFAPIDRRIRIYLSASAEIRVMLTARSQSVLQFPWRLWQLFSDYSHAELSLSLPDYSRSLKQTLEKSTGTVNILAILGSDDNIDVATDQQLLDQMPLAAVTILNQPTVSDLQHHLWRTQWDVLFFAGHSTSQGKGYFQVNPQESLTIEQLKYALKRAITNGLQLAVLNSCDGLGLAWALADLHLPQAIVMREPVSDAIAHLFLKNFLAALSSGRSLYSAVREAREKLHGLTELGSCASWLPVIVQNPAEQPPTWQSLADGVLTEQFRVETRSGVRSHTLPGTYLEKSVLGKSAVGKLALEKLALISLIVTATILGLRWVGLLQSAELWAYDWLLKLRPAESADPRIVIVTIDENDIRTQTSLERRGSLSDETLQQTLSQLNRYQPRVIALDLYRDFPASRTDLADTLAQSNIVGICKSLDPVVDQVGIGPAPELTEAQVGFSDFVEEGDGLLRRQLLTLTPDPVSPCAATYGFAVLTAIHYLQGEGLQPSFTPAGNLQIGETTFPRLQRRSGGLQQFDHRGNQILLNYRALPVADRIAAKVPLQQLLDGKVNPESLRDRIVLIGVTSASGDYWATPYGIQGQNRTPGVFLQAQMISQLISAVLDNRPLIWVWPQWIDACIVLAGSTIGGLLAMRWKSVRLATTYLVVVFGLVVGAWLMFLTGGWLPLVPTLLALGGGSLSMTTATRALRSSR